MKINEELSVLFWLFKAKKTKDGMIPIYVRITIKGIREEFSSGKKILLEDWDEERSKAKTSCPDSKSINSYIRKTQVELEKHFERLKSSSDEVTPKMVKDAYLPPPVIKKTLLQACQFHNGIFADKVTKGKGSPITLQRYERLERYTQEFIKANYKVSDLPIEEVQYSFAPEFFHHLIMKDIDDNTSMKYVKTLKQVIKKVVDHGWIKYNPIGGFKCPYKDPDRDYLEMHELISMYNKEIKVQRIREVRDVYVFCCFTGYAFETVYN